MGALLDKEREQNFDNLKIGFLLELYFRQNSLSDELRNFFSFVDDNIEFFTRIDLYCMTQGVNNFIDLFLHFTDLIYLDVDPDESHCKYHKCFY